MIPAKDLVCRTLTSEARSPAITGCSEKPEWMERCFCGGGRQGTGRAAFQDQLEGVPPQNACVPRGAGEFAARNVSVPRVSAPPPDGTAFLGLGLVLIKELVNDVATLPPPYLLVRPLSVPLMT